MAKPSMTALLGLLAIKGYQNRDKIAESAGVIAKFIMPGPNEPQGFILTAILGVVGAFVASFLGQMLGWYGPGEGAGLIGAVVGAIIVLFVYEYFAGRKAT